MSSIEFIDTRFNPDRTAFHGLAKQMASAFGYTAELALDRELAQLIRLRIAQLNSCAYCLILHTKKSLEAGIDPAKVAGLGAWWDTELFDVKEQAALVYAEALNDGVDPEFGDKHQTLAEHCSETEIAELAAVVINMNVWTRLKLAQGAVARRTSP